MFNIFTAIRRITTYHQGTESNSANGSKNISWLNILKDYR